MRRIAPFRPFFVPARTVSDGWKAEINAAPETCRSRVACLREACFFGTLKFNGGILFSLTPAVPRQTLRWQLEYEVHF